LRGTLRNISGTYVGYIRDIYVNYGRWSQTFRFRAW